SNWGNDYVSGNITTLTNQPTDFGSHDYTLTAVSGYMWLIPPGEVGTAQISFVSNAVGTPSSPRNRVSEYENGASRRICACSSLNMISSTQRNTWVSNVISYYSLTTCPPDNCVPTRVTDLNALLAATDLTVKLQWTAPGDDSLLGTGLGTCQSYDIRYRTDVPITDANWGTSTQLTGEPTPQVYGSPEQWNVTMPSSGTYYFAMKATDDVPLTSALSNCASVYLPSSAPSPKVLVLDRNPPEYFFYKPYNGVRDDFNSTVRIFDPFLYSLENLGVAYDLYIWDLPPNAGYNALLDYDVIFWCDTTLEDCGPHPEFDTSSLTTYDCWRVDDFLKNGGRMYWEGPFLGSSYTDVQGNGLRQFAPFWPMTGVEHYGYFAAEVHTIEALQGMGGTLFDGMTFKYDADAAVNYDHWVMDIAPPPRGSNAYFGMMDIDDPYYVGDTTPFGLERLAVNETIGAKVITNTVHFGGFTSWDNEFPNFRDEFIRRILQFFDFGGVNVYSTTEPILYPKWSNAGNKIAFINGVYGSADITVVHDPGIEGNPTITNISNVGITSIHHLSSISWSPDDQYIIYVASGVVTAGVSDLHIRRVPSNNSSASVIWQPVGALTDRNAQNIGVGRFVDPDYSYSTMGSPARPKIVASNFGELWVFNADGSGDATWDAVQITDFQGGNYFEDSSVNPKSYQPRWSPDDDSIVFVYRPAGEGAVGSGIYIISGVKNIVAGSTQAVTSLTDTRVKCIYPTGFKPAWSPSWTHDGNYVAFCLDSAGTFDNTAFWTAADTSIAASNFDVYFRDATLSHNYKAVQELNIPEGFEEWTYSGGDKFTYALRSVDGLYSVAVHGPEVTESAGINVKGASKNNVLIVNDKSKSSVKMSLNGYSDVSLSMRTPVRIKPPTNGLVYIGEAREIRTKPGSDSFKNGADLTVHFTKEEVRGINQNTLKLYFYDNSRNTWSPVDGSVVTSYDNGGYVSARVSKQGIYAIFSGKKASAFEDLSKMRVFPNPFRPNDGKGSTGTILQGIVIDRLPDAIDEIKVYNIAGDLVATTDGAVHYYKQADPSWFAPYLTVDPNGAVAVWYGNNDKNKRTASGVYLITIKTTTGHEEIIKVAIIW
ncbi:MAG TPA: hypothetical protein ENN73_00635, partial [Firmicutes bacterium]|nr:hypothetical protein [Bacillota bacterium]